MTPFAPCGAMHDFTPGWEPPTCELAADHEGKHLACVMGPPRSSFVNGHLKFECPMVGLEW